MEIYCQDEKFTLYQGSMLDMGKFIEPNSIDSVVTDPPYELGFMNKGWDNSGVAFQVDTWKKCYDALKPGGYLLAFGGSRTFHRIACAIEDAGFEIRDTIMWLYGAGFPKSMNIGLAIDKKNGLDNRTGEVAHGVNKHSDSAIEGGEFSEYYEERKAQNEWDGWGTCLKPAYEPIIIARKPFQGSCVENVLRYGVGGINIDECRIPLETDYVYKETNRNFRTNTVFTDDTSGMKNEVNHIASADPNGRFPSNVILTYDETDQDEVIGGFPITQSNGGAMTMPDFKDAGQKNSYNKVGFNDGETADRKSSEYIAPIDSGSAARYFYTAKASKRDRDEGLSKFVEHNTGELQGGRKEGSAGSIMKNADGGTRVNPYAGTGAPKRNTHPTVKPVDLMQYLVRLVTPKGGTILDPFNGSGSTGKAAMYENNDRNANYKYIGIELTPEYLPISEARIRYAITAKDIIPEKPISEEKKKIISNQMNLFDIS